MLNSPFAGLLGQWWHYSPYIYNKRTRACLRALYGGNTESDTTLHGGYIILRNPPFFKTA